MYSILCTFYTTLCIVLYVVLYIILHMVLYKALHITRHVKRITLYYILKLFKLGTTHNESLLKCMLNTMYFIHYYVQ